MTMWLPPFDGPNSEVISDFVERAVHLPAARLRSVDKQLESLYVERSVVTELVQASEITRRAAVELEGYLSEAAHRSTADRRDVDELAIDPEEIADVIHPTARALLVRDVLEHSTDSRRSRAYRALTAPFKDILPGRAP